MFSTLSRIALYWGRAVAQSGKAIVTLVLAILSALLAIRDGILPKEWREVFLAQYVPQQPWYVWALVCAGAVILFIILVVPTLSHKAALAQRAAFRKRIRENEVRHGIRHLVRESVREHNAKAEEKEVETEEPQKKLARPKFQVVAPAALPGLVKLDVNVIKRSKPNGETYFPIAVSFENIPEQDGFGEDDAVAAQISYREKNFEVIEMARVSSGCWIDEPLPSIKFPYRTPRFLLLGGWRLYGNESEKSDFRIFEYSRELHRHVEMAVHFGTPRTLMIEVLLIPSGRPDLGYEYKFEVPLFGACGYTIKQSLPSSVQGTHSEDAVDKEQAAKVRRQETLKGLIEFSEKGDKIFNRCKRGDTSQQLEADLIIWELDVETLLKDHLDKTRARLFISDAPMEEYPIRMSMVRHRTLLNRIYTRMIRLNRIIEELRGS